MKKSPYPPSLSRRFLATVSPYMRGTTVCVTHPFSSGWFGRPQC
ncbi:hypothetical protein J2S47_000550 [Streptomyces griseoviridis]|uniref:Uncharacterized protein n=1 Tax=Streptomyces griseoviridis TaxID=45398 RepID=A0ABT9L8N3_STRGD|nr:hypothetical protein [Streptomyces griseoviridis]